MLSVPLPFVIAFCLLLFLYWIVFDGKPWTTTKALFTSLIVIAIIDVVMIPLHWLYGYQGARMLQPVVASLVPPVAWLSFLSLSTNIIKKKIIGFLALLIPTLAICVLLAIWPGPIDIIVIAQFLTYGLMLLQLSKAGPDMLKETQLHRSSSANRAIFLAAITLIGNALIDMFVLIDFQVSGGQHVSLIISAASLFVLLTLGATAMTAKSALQDDPEVPSEETDDEVTTHYPGGLTAADMSPEEIRDIIEKVKIALGEQRLFVNPDLTLSKIARKVGIQARLISMAINRHHGINVSQYVNNFRIAEAVRLLDTTEELITNIHIDAGFLTKSNFNREFRRQFDCSPSEWRKRHQAASSNVAQTATTNVT